VSVLVCAHNESPVNCGKGNFPVSQRPAARQQLTSVSKSNGDRDGLRRRAEADAGKAADLRKTQTEKNLKATISLFQESVRLFKAAGSYRQAADARLQIGEIYFILSQFDKALSSYRGVLQLDGKNPELLCLVSSHVARTYAFIGNTSQADRYSSQALSQCSVLPDPRLQAEGLEARGETLNNLGQLAESADFLNRAQELFGKAQDKSAQAHALLTLAYARFRDDRSEALQFAGKALRLWSSDHDEYGVAEARTALGAFALATDEFETALCSYGMSLPVFHSVGDKDNEAVALNGIGYASGATGDLHTSLENHSHAWAIFDNVQDNLGAVEALTGMGRALGGLRQYQRLIPLYETKLQLARQNKNFAQEASALADMAGIYELQHQYRKAKMLYLRSLAKYRSAKNRAYGEGDILIRLARLHMRQGENTQAISLLENARALKDKIKQVEDVAKIHYELASIYLRLNRLEDARTTIEKTIDIIEFQRLKIKEFDSRAAYFASVHKYYALYIQVLMLLRHKQPEQAFEQLAFEASERSKVRSLLDLLSASSQDSPCDELLQRQLVQDSIETQAPDVKQAASATPVLNLKEIQAEIGSDDTVLLEYMLGDENSYVWVVDSKHIVAYQLPQSNKISKLVGSFRKALTAREPLPGENNPKEYHERVGREEAAYPLLARQLSRLLLAPVDLSRAKRVLIVPDGPLQYIPFSALPLPQASAKNAPLISRHEVVLLPSASALSTLRKAAEKRTLPTRTAIIIADPVVERNDPRVRPARNARRTKPQERLLALKIALRHPQGSQHVASLPGSRAEAEAIQNTLSSPDVDLALGFNASRDFVVQGGIDRYRIVHFATHGIIDASHPEMSRLILSLVNERGQLQDGYLRLGDIYKLKLSADLVVLSACNSALGKDLESEGIIGLPRGFLYAGSRSVIASLWKVDDEAAEEFMRGFYARIQRGESPSSALQGAQLEMAQGNSWPQPFYWAAFVLQGDYK
jgi:CHAT domain-containing protein